MQKTSAVLAAPFAFALCFFGLLWFLFDRIDPIVFWLMFAVGLAGGAAANFSGAWFIQRIIDERTAEVESSTLNLKKSEREAQARDKAVVKSASAVSFTLDSVGKIKEVSRSAQTMWARDPQALVGKKFVELVPQKMRTALADDLGNAFETKQRTTINTTINLGGAEVPMRIAARRSSDGHELYCVARDATSFLEREKQLREAEERIDFVIDRMPSAYILLDEKFQVIRFNSEALRYFRVESDALKNLPVREVFSISGERDFDGSTSNRELRHPGGKTTTAQVTLSKYKDEKAARYIIMFLDVTDLQRARANRERLADVISSQVAIPLTTIQDTLLALRNGKFGPLDEASTARASAAHQQCKQIIDSFKQVYLAETAPPPDDDDDDD
jgi:PAS domain S-box-containing protein